MGGWAGQILLEHAPKVSLIVGLALTKRLAEEQKRTFSDDIFYHIKLRKLDPSERTATKRPCRVYYTRMHILYPMLYFRYRHYTIDGMATLGFGKQT